MITTCIPVSARLGFLKGLYALGDTYKMALFYDTGSLTLDSSSTTYGTTGEATGTGYTAGGVTLSGYTASSDSGGAWLTWTSPSWTTATFTTNGAVIYDTTASNAIIAIFSFGANYSVAAGTFTVQFPTSPSSSNALIYLN